MNFLKSNQHSDVYASWFVELNDLDLSIVHIPGVKNKVEDGLSRTLFHSPECLPDDSVLAAKERIESEGPKWIRSDLNDGFEAFLKPLDESQKCEVLN